ncbi:MAG TPA: hypothetical protein VFY97_09260 [Rhodanobacteraceae bacterium]|nr:hypothetical protein [Rhodanobacteraceae bacterium]
MDALPEYLNLCVSVALDVDGTVTCRPKQLTIPTDAIATITWIRTSGKFRFRAFKWCQNNGFLTQTPIIHDGCVISAVHNTAPDNQGTYCYRLTVAAGNIEYSTPECPPHFTSEGGGSGNGQPKIKNL